MRNKTKQNAQTEILYQESLIIFSYILKAKLYLKSDAKLQIYPKSGKRIHFSVVV